MLTFINVFKETFFVYFIEIGMKNSKVRKNVECEIKTAKLKKEVKLCKGWH